MPQKTSDKAQALVSFVPPAWCRLGRQSPVLRSLAVQDSNRHRQRGPGRIPPASFSFTGSLKVIVCVLKIKPQG